MKKDQLKAKLVVEVGIVLSGIVILAGLIWYLSSLNDKYMQEGVALKTEVNTLSGTTNMLLDKYTRVKKNGQIYLEALSKKEEGKLDISREMVRDKFNQLNSRYYLSSMRLVMGGTEDIPATSYKTNSGVIVTSGVTVNADSVSDEHIFNMLNAMQQELPGSVSLTRFTIGRNSVLNDEILRTIGQNGTFGLVKAEINFLWYGVKFIETPPGTDPNAPKPAP